MWFLKSLCAFALASSCLIICNINRAHAAEDSVPAQGILDEDYCRELRARLAVLANDYADAGATIDLDSFEGAVLNSEIQPTVAPDVQPSQANNPWSVTVTAELMERAMELLQRECRYSYADLADVLINDSNYLPIHANIIINFYEQTGFVSYQWF